MMLEQARVVDLSEITRKYFWDFEDPDVINSGWCFVWAWLAHLKTGAQLVSYHTGFRRIGMGLNDAHAFVRIGALYYDSSAPRGVPRKHMNRLWFFHEAELRVYSHRIDEQSPEHFKIWWNLFGRQNSWGSQGLAPWPTELP
jgi:hypothetical protein